MFNDREMDKLVVQQDTMLLLEQVNPGTFVSMDKSQNWALKNSHYRTSYTLHHLPFKFNYMWNMDSYTWK